jgi:NAD(P)-dependent dehydrogenase (short-subunit alcohol dehydrogenase family)
VALITGGSGGMGRAITKAGAQPAVYGVLSAEIAAGNFSQ